jgi:hypothetical protein
LRESEAPSEISHSHPERLFKTSEDNLSLFKDFISSANNATIEKQNHTTEAK